MKKPPFQITPKILELVGQIERQVGRLEGVSPVAPQPKLRRQNRIRTIQGSLAIEGNTLSIEQVTAVLDGKPVIGDATEIREVINALQVYEASSTFSGHKAKDLLRAHAMMMAGILPDAGQWRDGNVGIIRGKKVTHIAPKAAMVPQLMSNLLKFVKDDRDVSTLIKACVFHYELEFIHPFSDGNGRMGRLWQQVILCSQSPIFGLVPVESLIKERQAEYYEALRASDKKAECSAFLEFSLTALKDGLEDLSTDIQPVPLTAEMRLDFAIKQFGSRLFSRKDYLTLFKNISAPTASRDLTDGVARGILDKTGDKALTRYRKR